jgi:cyclopropane-fatty-acyl-phospholipid synthase
MNLFTFEQTKAVYWADFVFYAAMILVLTGVLAATIPTHGWPTMAFLVTVGLTGWSALEYAVHRFVLHGVQPFRRWHAAHHARPAALICSPTMLTAPIIAVCLFLPAWAMGGLGNACALTIGLLCGYLAYALVHHAIHHWPADSKWLRRRKRWHFLHHDKRNACCYGVTSGLWDSLCGSTRARGATPPATADPPSQVRG